MNVGNLPVQDAEQEFRGKVRNSAATLYVTIRDSKYRRQIQ